MESMTGFGSSSIKGKDFKTFISIKSVNSRFVDMKFYLSSFYTDLENEWRKVVLNKVVRGQFYIRVNRVPETPITPASIQWNHHQARKWINTYNKISKQAQLKNDLTVSELIHQEGVIEIQKSIPTLTLYEKKQIRKAFDQALQSCIQERKREGNYLKKEILKYYNLIQKDLRTIKSLSKKQRSKMNIKIKNNKKEWFDADKTDISEEIVRTEEHLKHFKNLLHKSQSSGKKIDFYLQELLREVNTIGSKSQISTLTKSVIEIKFNLEKIKEQVQNIE